MYIIARVAGWETERGAGHFGTWRFTDLGGRYEEDISSKRVQVSIWISLSFTQRQLLTLAQLGYNDQSLAARRSVIARYRGTLVYQVCT